MNAICSTAPVPIALFRIGRIVATPTAQESLSQADILAGIQRHQAGDWGEVSEHDREANNRALENGTRLVSAYHSAKRVRFWIITEADRSATTVLLPQDY
jgi:hypothetical protein